MDHPLLDRVVLGGGAWFDARRRCTATRLTLMGRPGTEGVCAAELLDWLATQWPPGLGPLLLNLGDEDLLDALLQQPCPEHLVLEWPSFLALAPQRAVALLQHAAQGGGLVIKGHLAQPLPDSLRACFRQQLISQAQLRAGAQPSPGQAWVLTDAHLAQEAAEGLRRGAQAVQGWPLGEAPPPGTRCKNISADVRVVMDLIQRIDRDESPARLEAVLRGSPTLGFRLLRYINSPGFGLSVEVNSFQHAVMLLGSQRLKRWLALLLTGSVDDPNLKPLMLLAVRRGLLMESLLPEDDERRGEAFLCGVFSLLDRMLGQAFDRLLADLPVPQPVAMTLLGQGGPLQPLLQLACATEAESPHDILEAADALMLSPRELNRAVLRSLVLARRMQMD